MSEARKEKVKQLREKRLSRTNMDDSYEFIEATPAEGESYTHAIKRQLLSVDLSNQSTYVQLGIGGATGWFTGVMVGKVGKALAAALGGSILLINMGTRAGYLTVDWEKVDNDMRDASDKITQRIIEEQQNNRTQRIVDQVSMFVRRNVVTAGGFAAGFFLGMAT